MYVERRFWIVAFRFESLVDAEAVEDDVACRDDDDDIDDDLVAADGELDDVLGFVAAVVGAFFEDEEDVVVDWD